MLYKRAHKAYIRDIATQFNNLAFNTIGIWERLYDNEALLPYPKSLDKADNISVYLSKVVE